MAADFDGVVARVRMRIFEHRDQHFVEHPPFGRHDAAEMGGVAVLRAQFFAFKNGVGKVQRLRAGQPDDTDSAHTGRRGECDDGVGKIG